MNFVRSLRAKRSNPFVRDYFVACAPRNDMEMWQCQVNTPYSKLNTQLRDLWEGRSSLVSIYAPAWGATVIHRRLSSLNLARSSANPRQKGIYLAR